MKQAEHDLVVIGAGPGGYVAAIRAAQLGLNVACIEKASKLGGTCLRVGCIPSKALLEASERYAQAQHEAADFGIKLKGISLDLPQMMKRKDEIVDGLTGGIAGLFKKNKVTHYKGHGQIKAAGKVEVTGDDPVELSAKHIIIATGSVSAGLKGIEIDRDRVGTSTEALSYPEVPGHLVVIGAGVIGLELGSVWARLGSKVSVLEYMDRILPGMDDELAKSALKSFKKQGLEFHLGKKVTGARAKGKKAVVEVEGMDPIEADRVLVCVGRLPNTGKVGLENVGIETGPRGVIPVDKHFQTSVPGIYAIGDAIPGPMLAHKAEEEGVACVEMIVNGWGHVDYNTIPGVVYTEPEIASVGKTEEQLKEAGVAYNKGSFPYMANGRARALNAKEGWVKILADASTDKVLGVHIIGARAGDLIAECTAAMAYGASSEDIARTCHAHPTLAEIVKEAALAVDKRQIHM